MIERTSDIHCDMPTSTEAAVAYIPRNTVAFNENVRNRYLQCNNIDIFQGIRPPIRSVRDITTDVQEIPEVPSETAPIR